jgi:tetratricopeptide (TPR) repeat protein
MQVQRLIAGLVDSGQYQDALVEFEAALSRHIDNNWIYNGAGSAYMALERYPESIQAFTKEPIN